MKEGPAISVIIPSFNEERYIGHVIDGLKKQTFRDFEAIVVDKNSTDATRRIVGKNARFILEGRPGIGRARNTGAKAAKGRILVFLDADTRPSTGLLQEYFKAFREPSVVAATGPILPLEEASRRVGAGYWVVSVLFVKLSILFGRPSVVGLNFAARKDVFERIGGFNERFQTYEDWDLSLRLRRAGRIVYLKKAVVETSVRRVKAWGVSGFFIYHSLNIIRYHLFGRPNEEYEPIR